MCAHYSVFLTSESQFTCWLARMGYSATSPLGYVSFHKPKTIFPLM